MRTTTWLFLLVALCCASNNKFVPYFANSTGPPFTQVFIPLNYSTIHFPKSSNYVNVFFPFNTQYWDLCTLRHVPCFANFTMLQKNETNWNFCRYCVTEERNVSDWQLFDSQYASSEQGKDCGAANNYAIAWQELINKKEQMIRANEAMTWNSTLVCYCASFDRYGYHCDAYTQYGTIVSYVGFKFLFIVIIVPLLVVILFLHCIPECSARKQVILEEVSCWKRPLHLLDIQMQAIYFLALALVFCTVEQVVSLIGHSKNGEAAGWKIYPGGVYRAASFTFMLLSYAACLFKFSNIFSRLKQLSSDASLTRGHKILLTIFYIAIVLSLSIAITVQAILLQEEIFYSIISGFLLVYFLLFPVGFTIYAIRVYCLLKRSKASRTTTKFTLLLNLVCSGVYGVSIPVFVTYIRGYDFCGLFIGIYRNVMLDFSLITACLLLMYVLFNNFVFQHIYCNKRRLKQFELQAKRLVDQEEGNSSTPYELSQ